MAIFAQTPPNPDSAKDIPLAPVKNPHVWWRDPYRWRQWQRIQALHRDYGSARMDVNEFEARILVPELQDRVNFFQQLFEQLKAICQDPVLPQMLAGPLSVALGAGPLTPAFIPQVKKYLADTETMIDKEYIAPLKAIAAAPAIDDVPALGRFLQRLHWICGSILSSKDVLFRFRFQKQMEATNLKTGAVIVSPPEEYDLILSYFRVALDQLVRTASATEDSIQHWKQQVDAAKKPFLEFLAASTNATTSRRTIVVQVLAIFLALSFSTFFLTVRDPFALRRENSVLRAEIAELKQAFDQRSAELGGPRVGADGRLPLGASASSTSSTDSGVGADARQLP